MSLIKIFSVLTILCSFSFSAIAHDEAEGESSHNGVVEKMSPEQVKEKIAEKKAIKKAKAQLKADGKYTKEDRKKIKKMKKEMRSKTAKAEVPPPPSKDTQQMIDEADQEPETDMEDPAGTPE